MRWTVSTGDLAKTRGDLIVLPVVMSDEAANLDPVVKLAGGHGDLVKVIESGGFRAATGDTLPIHCGGLPAGWILLVGLGKPDEVSLDGVRRAAGRAAQAARSMKAGTVLALPTLVSLGFDAETVARCWVEGAEMALAAAGPADAKRLAKEGPTSWKLLPT